MLLASYSKVPCRRLPMLVTALQSLALEEMLRNFPCQECAVAERLSPGGGMPIGGNGTRATIRSNLHSMSADVRVWKHGRAHAAPFFERIVAKWFNF